MRSAPTSRWWPPAYVIVVLLCAGLTAQAFAQEPIYIIRHAEKELSGTDPALTETGRKRAAAWAEMFRPSELNIILTSDAKRTRETGGIIARSLGIPHKEFPIEDVAGLIDLIEFDHEQDNVLIVGHTETIPQILSNLGSFEDVEIGQSDFANLFVLVRQGTDEPQLIRLRMPAQ